MTRPIDILVVIVNYKSAALTEHALRSLAREAQHPELRLRVAVVENDSGDEAALRAMIDREFAQFARLVVSKTNGGFGSGNNLGVRDALDRGESPDYVHCLNPDTEIREGAVLELARFLAAHERVGLVGGRFLMGDGTPWSVAFRFPTPFGEFEAGAHVGVFSRLLARYSIPIHLGDEPARVDWVSGASMMIRTSLFRSIGGFDESFFLYFEETDLCHRVRDAGYECWYVPASVVVHHAGQSTGVTDPNAGPRRRPSYWFESRRRYFRKNHGDAVAVVADLSCLAGTAIGNVRDRLRGIPTTPHFLRDLARQSALWPQNRHALERARSVLTR